MKKLLLCICLLATSFYSQSQCSKVGCNAPISILYVNNNNNIYVGTTADETKANCSPVANVYFTLKADAQNKKEIYATLLAAYMAKKKIFLRVNEGTEGCEIAYITLSQ